MNKGRKSAPSSRDRRRLLRRVRSIGIAVALLSVTAGGLAAYKHNYDVTHDLSVIGNGTPTVVQVHDPGCQMCQRLKRNVNSVKAEFEDDVQFRIADIHTRSGRALAVRHDVPHVTLLLFDGNGELLRVLNGVKSPDVLRPTFETLR